MLKYIVTTLAMLAAVTTASAKDLPDCDTSNVQDTLQQATRAIKVIAVQNIQSRDPTEERWCMGQVITASGNFKTVAFTLRWTSAAEGRYMLQTQASAY
jgi:hypothetical protein